MPHARHMRQLGSSPENIARAVQDVFIQWQVSTIELDALIHFALSDWDDVSPENYYLLSLVVRDHIRATYQLTKGPPKEMDDIDVCRTWVHCRHKINRDNGEPA